MKNKFSLFIFAISVTFSLQAQNFAKLIIRNSSSAYPPFIISLNGIRINQNYASSVTADYLEDNEYRLKLLQSGTSGVINFTISTLPNYVSKYVLLKDSYGNFTLLLESKSLLSLEPQTTPTLAPTVTSNITPTVIVTNTLIVTNTVTSTPVLTVAPSPQAMNDADYNGIVSAIKKESLESSRLSMAKTFLTNQNYTSQQVLGVLKVFSLESSRINFAKFAYAKTIDKPNYYKVYEGFSLSSSKKELSDFINKN
jgi:hypothetical protein